MRENTDQMFDEKSIVSRECSNGNMYLDMFRYN